MKRILVFLLGLFVFAFVPVSAQSAAEIVVLLPDSFISRWVADDQRFLEEAFDSAGVSYEIFNANADTVTQIAQAEQAIGNGAKVLLLVNLDSNSGAEIIEIARSQGVVVIDYDRLTIEGEGADYYVSFDNVAVGRLQGQGLVDAVQAAQADGRIEGTPHIVVLDGSPTDNNATLFRNGAFEIIQPYFDSGEWILVEEAAVPNWELDQAQLIFEAIQVNSERVDAVLAANDGLANAVVQTRLNFGLDFIPVTGQDAMPLGIQNILAGRQSMTVYKAIRTEARAVAGLAIAVITNNRAAIDTMINGSVNNGTNDIPSILLTPVTVTIDNIEETVIADGFRTWDEICVAEFAEYCD